MKPLPKHEDIYHFRDALIRVKRGGRLSWRGNTYTVNPRLAGRRVVLLQKYDGTLWAKRLEDEYTELYPLAMLTKNDCHADR